MRRGTWVAAIAVLLLTGVAICQRESHGGSARRPAGPNVVGLSLVSAEARLDRRNIGYVEHLEAGELPRRAGGATARQGWVVCSESYVNAGMVQLNTHRTAC